MLARLALQAAVAMRKASWSMSSPNELALPTPVRKPRTMASTAATALSASVCASTSTRFANTSESTFFFELA